MNKVEALAAAAAASFCYSHTVIGRVFTHPSRLFTQLHKIFNHMHMSYWPATFSNGLKVWMLKLNINIAQDKLVTIDEILSGQKGDKSG